MKKLLFFLSLFLLMIASPINAQDNNYVPGQILVKFKDTAIFDIDKQVKKHGASVLGKIEKLDVFVLKVPGAAENMVLNALSKNPFVEYAEADYLAQAFFTPNDQYFSDQWGLENIGQSIKGVVGVPDADIDAVEAWDATRGGALVAVLDTGIDQNHEDVSSKIVSNKNYTDSPTPDDLYGHGTHVGGIIAAETDNSKGVAGGCPACTLLNVKVLNDSGSGAYSWVANGIIFASDNGAKVINMSLGGSFSSRTLQNAVNYAWNKGVVVVAAAGNSANPSKTYPAAYPNAIAVAATNNKDQKPHFQVMVSSGSMLPLLEKTFFLPFQTIHIK